MPVLLKRGSFSLDRKTGSGWNPTAATNPEAPCLGGGSGGGLGLQGPGQRLIRVPWQCFQGLEGREEPCPAPVWASVQRGRC